MSNHTNRHVGAAEIKRIRDADLKFVRYNNRRALRPEVGRLEEKLCGEAIAFRDPTYRDNRYYNRIVGLGDAALPCLDNLITFYHEIGMAAAIMLTPDQATKAVLTAIQARQFALAETVSVFTLVPGANHGPAPAIVVRQALRADFVALAGIWTQDAKPPPAPALIAERTAIHFVPEFTFYLALLDGQIAAIASIYATDGVAWLGNATTAHGFRNRGCQLALLNHRVRAAAQMGCDLAVVDTSFGSSSHRNVERAGFRLAYQEMTVVGPDPA